MCSMCQRQRRNQRTNRTHSQATSVCERVFDFFHDFKSQAQKKIQKMCLLVWKSKWTKSEANCVWMRERKKGKKWRGSQQPICARDQKWNKCSAALTVANLRTLSNGTNLCTLYRIVWACVCAQSSWTRTLPLTSLSLSMFSMPFFLSANHKDFDKN